MCSFPCFHLSEELKVELPAVIPWGLISANKEVHDENEEDIGKTHFPAILSHWFDKNSRTERYFESLDGMLAGSEGVTRYCRRGSQSMCSGSLKPYLVPFDLSVGKPAPTASGQTINIGFII